MLFELDNTYNFRSISNTIIEPIYTNLKVVSYLNLRTALKYTGVFSDVVTIRQQLVDVTGIELVKAVDAKYVLFENEHGDEILLAEDWVDIDSITLVTSVTLNLKVKSITSSDTAIILNALRAMGYNDLDTDVT